jgi:outer membrane protein OmpA-like peptidoglycan-associated protein
MKTRRALTGFLLSLALCVVWQFGFAQEPNPTSNAPNPAPAAQNVEQVNQPDHVPLYRVRVVERNLDAVNYFHRSGSTEISLHGTDLLPQAHGNARIESKSGRVVIDTHVDGLGSPSVFGPEYSTYVLWAITPDGRPHNLGEIIPQGKFSMTVTSPVPAFGLIVTAEPYFAVSQPSDVVVMQNVIEGKTSGVLEQVNAHYTLLARGAYTQEVAGVAYKPPKMKDDRTLELTEAHNAVELARVAGAEQYAPDIFQQAKTDLRNADNMDASRGDKKQEITYAREAVERAEDARISSLRKQAAEHQQQTEDARVRAENQAAQAQLEAQQANLAAQQAAAAKAQADADRARAEAEAATARAQASAATQDAYQAREKLRAQLNSVLVTTETARGLIVSVPDVLFASGKYELTPDAKVKMAKVAGILFAYPGLRLQVEGHTDSVGGEEYNQRLSEERAGAVRDFLVRQGVPMNNVAAVGYGKTEPIASNDTTSGRAQNRRVEMVVSGNAIGINTERPTPGGGVSQ